MSVPDSSHTSKPPLRRDDSPLVHVTRGSPSSSGRPAGDGRRDLPAALAGLLLFGFAVGVSLAKECPSSAQLFMMVAATAVGLTLVVYGFLRLMHLEGTLSGFSVGGAGAVLLLVYLAKPALMSELKCTAYTLQGRIHLASDATQAIPGARITVLGKSTEHLEANHLGEFRYPYTEAEIGMDIQLWVDAPGYQRSQLITVTLPSRPMRLSLPLQALPRPPGASPPGTNTGRR